MHHNLEREPTELLWRPKNKGQSQIRVPGDIIPQRKEWKTNAKQFRQQGTHVRKGQWSVTLPVIIWEPVITGEMILSLAYGWQIV